MTKDDFIFNLKRCGCLYKDGNTYYEENELIECFEDVGEFNQPSANPRKPCDDAVSRDGVYGILMRGDFVDRLSYEMFKNRLEQLPPVNPQEPTGHWISEKVDGEDWKGCKRQYYQPISCSKCHSPNHYKSTYCPNCGARMQGSEG